MVRVYNELLSDNRADNGEVPPYICCVHVKKVEETDAVEFVNCLDMTMPALDMRTRSQTVNSPARIGSVNRSKELSVLYHIPRKNKRPVQEVLDLELHEFESEDAW